MPKDWELRPPHSTGGCRPINGIYRNLGVGTLGDQPELGVARLDAALGRAVPPSHEPKLVAISFDSENQKLQFRYLGSEQYYRFEASVSCEEGWLTWSTSLSDQYLADGVSLEKSDETIRLIEGANSELVVHSRGQAVYSSAIIVRDKEITERWSKFKRAEQ